jgi:hypothetical protein
MVDHSHGSNSRPACFRLFKLGHHPQPRMAVFHERYPRETLHWVEITDTLPDNCAVYNRPADCWFVLFLPNEFRWRLISSRLVAISKSTREIVYDGDAGDEG